MKRHYAKDFLDAYRMHAKSKDINDLSGRISNAAATRFIAERIANRISLGPEDSLVDVGCGDGTLVLNALARGLTMSSVVGILPTSEEVHRVRTRVAMEYSDNTIIRQGLSDCTGLADGFATKCVCNSVLLTLPDRNTILSTLSELARITRPGGIVFIGELPDMAMERLAAPREANNSSAFRLVKGFIKRQLERFDRDVLVVSAPSKIEIQPVEFERLAAERDLRSTGHTRSTTLLTGKQQDIPHRWDYVFERV